MVPGHTVSQLPLLLDEDDTKTYHSGSCVGSGATQKACWHIVNLLNVCITFIYFFIFLRFYLFIETERERERQRHKQREKQASYREPDVGLDPRSPGSRPGLQAALNRCATGAALFYSFDTIVNEIVFLIYLSDSSLLVYKNTTDFCASISHRYCRFSSRPPQ